MYQKFKRITAVLLSVLMVVGMFLSMSVAASETDENDNVEIKKGEFTFAPHTYTDGDLTDIYYYTDAVFSESAFEYNEHLATMSMILAAASISSQDADASYEVKSRNLNNLLADWDFTGFDVNEYYKQKPGEQTMGVGMAYKVIGEGDDAYTLLAIVPRSAGYQKEWAGNFTVGKDGVHEGFATGRDIILEFAKKYIEENGDKFEGTVKIWTVGYSRGAGVANLLAAYLDDNTNALGVELKKENIFTYTFGTPSNVQYDDEEEKAALESNYLNIHNRYSEYDIVTYAPFKNWNFAFYGTTKVFDVQNAEKKAEMLTFLEKTNELIYDIYTEEGSAADPDNFTPLMIQLNMIDGEVTFEIVPADPEYEIPTNQKDFLDSRIEFLVENLVPDRDTYVDGGYQYALQRLTSLYFGLDAEQGALLFEGMSHDVTTLAAAYYCYYLSEHYLATEEKSTDASYALIETLEMLEMYVELLADVEEVNTSDWYLYVSAYIASEEYTQMKDTLQFVLYDPGLWAASVQMLQSTIKDFAVGITAKVLGSGVAALTLEETEKTELMETMTSEEVAAPLTEFFVYLLLGSEDDVVAPFDAGNKNIALAVTFLSNAGRYMRVHNNEIILSWLRTEDSYYENEDWHIHDTEVKYDNNGHWAECACGYKEKIYTHTFGDWSTNTENDSDIEVMVRRCTCGYEEIIEDPDAGDLTGTIMKPFGIVTVGLICGGSFMIIATMANMIVISKKRKTCK